MKTIHCDGCGRDITQLTPSEYEWTVSVQNNQITKSAGTYDLCTRCASTLCKEAKPTSWTRISPVAA